MSSTKEQVISFLEKCEELKKCKFIMATTKIKDLLKCIVNSPDLYKLFDTVTKDFNYLEQKAKCLVTENNGVIKNRVLLPQTVGQRLAFIFCLLVEFDRGTLSFNDFLQVYFPEDGSYFASYQAFCKTIISSLEELLKQVFKEQLNSNEEVKPNSKISGLISAIVMSIGEEKQFIEKSSLSGEEKENGIKLLDTLAAAVKAGNEELIDALICGYNYFVLYNRCVSDGIASVIEMLAEFEECI